MRGPLRLVLEGPRGVPILVARQAFNDAVALYNTRRESFPGVLLAGGFPRREHLQIDPTARAVPDASV